MKMNLPRAPEPSLSSPSSGCPACSATAEAVFVEEHFDRIGAKSYRLQRCPSCGVVFAEPREVVGADWYVKSAPIRDRERRPAPETDWRYQQFFSDGLTVGRLLDIGCGDGGFMVMAKNRGFAPTGFDYDERVVDLARSKGLEDVHVMEFSAFIAGRRSAEFDAATLFDVLEHTPEPAWFLGHIKRLLKPGAYVAITLPNGLRPLPWGREEHDFPPHHFTRWTPRALKGFLERQGFAVVRQEADALTLRYLSDHFFFHRLMPGVLALARRALFGRRSATEGRTLSELYASAGGAKAGALGDKLIRQRIVDAARLTFQWLSAPAALALRGCYRLSRPHSGQYLYTLARLM
jgi:2-polyprenyl-3-methyl-5-hydroxy-6-metoxy-1,4-benzoquinol methylase